MEALITYDKRADENMLASKGMDASISNVSKRWNNIQFRQQRILQLHDLPGQFDHSGRDCLSGCQPCFKAQLPREIFPRHQDRILPPTIAKQQDITPSQRMGNQEETS